MGGTITYTHHPGNTFSIFLGVAKSKDMYIHIIHKSVRTYHCVPTYVRACTLAHCNI